MVKLLLSLIFIFGLSSKSEAIDSCLSPDDSELIGLLNDYRVQNGLTSLPPSFWLGSTAQWKIWDRLNNPSAVGGSCSTHSWSNNPPSGVAWTGMCYTMDHAQAAQMWAKPRQISASIYTGNGYELTADSGGTQTPAQALSQWQNSPAHNAVILQQGQWAGVNFRGLGVDLSGGYAILWFGDGLNSGGLMEPCQTETVFEDGFEN